LATHNRWRWIRERSVVIFLSLSWLLILGTKLWGGQQTPTQGGSLDDGYEAKAGDITMALTGDSLISTPLRPFREERFLKVRDLLLKADVRFTNSEMLFHNYENWPNPYAVGNLLRADPKIIGDLQWIGFNLVSCANNHTDDFGENGVLTNIHYLNEAGLVHAGTGSDYAEAVAPAYLETPNGRVGLIAATSTGEVSSRAGEQLRDYKGTPGVNFIRWITEWTVDRETFDVLKRVAQQFKWDQGGGALLSRFYEETAQNKSTDVVSFADRNSQGMPTSTKTDWFIADPPARFVLGTSFEKHSRIFREDFQRNLQSVSDAHRMADWVIYSIHNHESGDNDDMPADHIVTIAHSVIDSGADVFVGAGPHRVRGIEIYKGKPVFYSLGDFIMENLTTQLVSC
jgi:poly-gamma-glutamate capsule biosynthesis protein CapA/YwtB (metallophosphatase superfamily)